MKKLSIIMLALAFAIVSAGAAFAGDVSMTGKYVFDGEDRSDNTGAEGAWYDDDLDITLKITEGNVTAGLALEISDDETFDGGDINNSTGGGTSFVNDYYVMYQAMDNLSLKFGQYGYTFGNAIGAYAYGGHNVQANYGLDAADISLILSKIEEDGEDDDDSMILTVNVKEAGPFTKLGFAYISETNDASGDDEEGFIGLEAALPIGPVAFSLEYGSFSSDGAGDGGNYMLFGFGLDELVGFDLDLLVFNSNEDLDASMFGNDYDAMKILTGDIAETTWAALAASYAYNDNLTLAGKALVYGVAGPDDDTIGMEFDLSGTYALADNASYAAGYASWAPGDIAGADDDTYTKLWHRLTFTF